MTDSKRSKITEEHREEARKLKALWDSRTHRSQAQFGEAYSLGNQSNVGHYLNARSPLNLGAALAFSQELGVEIHEFSPRLAQQRNALAHGLAPKGTAVKVATEMADLLASPKIVPLELALESVSSFLSSIGDYNTKSVSALFDMMATHPTLHEAVALGLRKIKQEVSTAAKQGAPATQGIESKAA